MGDGPAAGTATRNEAVVREAIAVLAGGDEALASDIVDPDYRDHASAGVERGPQGFLAQRRRMRCPFADVELNAHEMVVGDGHVAVRLRFRGLHVGPYAGVEPCGRTIERDEIHIWRLADGMLIEHWACLDDLTALRQMGAAVRSPDES
jgi:predicted ester cyclase